MRAGWGVVAAVALMLSSGCSALTQERRVPASPPVEETGGESSSPSSRPPEATEPAVVYAAGDIVGCRSMGDEATARLIPDDDSLVLTLGDHVYDDGTVEEYEECYSSTWGEFKKRTRPAVGDHEYGTQNAAGHFGYFKEVLEPFGPAATDYRRGFYSYDVGTWHVIALNTSCLPRGCADQMEWLEEDLKENSARCTLAYYHQPPYSSRSETESSTGREFFNLLDTRGADVVLNGHNHSYERFAPRNSDGEIGIGVRQFIVGTGGRSLYPFDTERAPGSEVRNADTFGVLRLSLATDSYRWDFLPVEGGNFKDGGQGKCR